MSTDPTPLWDAPETAQFWPDGYDRLIVEEVDSTMAEARRRAGELAGPTWIMAKRQTAAHGRRGKAWATLEGNFAATLFYRPDCNAQTAALRTFVAANALFWALAMEARSDRLSLKWPNDVLLNGGKVAGILLESSGTGEKVDWLAIGIGVNLAAAPAAESLEPDALPPVSLKQETAQTISPEDFLFWLASHFADQERMFGEFGFDPIRRLWLQHAARLGEPIKARTSREEFTGTFETVDEAGQLVLRTAKGQVAIPAGDVFF